MSSAVRSLSTGRRSIRYMPSIVELDSWAVIVRRWQVTDRSSPRAVNSHHARLFWWLVGPPALEGNASIPPVNSTYFSEWSSFSMSFG